MTLLWSSAWHQGTVYSAAALATPFLLDAALNPAVHDRAGMLLMAAAAARRYRFHNRGRGDLLGVAYTEPWYDTAGQRIDCTNEAARAVIASRASAIGALLDDPDPRLRTVAAYTLSAAAPGAPDIAAALRARLTIETDATTQITLALSTAEYLHETGRGSQAKDLAATLWPDAALPAGIRLGAAISWLCLTDEAPAPHLTSLINDCEAFDPLRQVPWLDHLRRPGELNAWLAGLLDDTVWTTWQTRQWHLDDPWATQP